MEQLLIILGVICVTAFWLSLMANICEILGNNDELYTALLRVIFSIMVLAACIVMKLYCYYADLPPIPLHYEAIVWIMVSAAMFVAIWDYVIRLKKIRKYHTH